jgi:hypothetical protein
MRWFRSSREKDLQVIAYPLGLELLRRRLYRVEPKRRVPIREQEAEVIPLWSFAPPRTG